MPRTLALVVLAPLVSSTPASPSRTGGEDRVVLANGRELRGCVVYEDEETIVLRKGTRDRELERADVAEVESRAQRLRELLAETDYRDPWRLSEEKDLARKAQALGLSPEARLFWWRAIACDPSDEEAHAALGHRKSGEAWRVRHRGRWVKLDRLRKIARDFGKAWQFQTTHYRLTSNLGLEQTLDLALDLERFYAQFFELLGRDLHLYEIQDPLDIEVHADVESFPDRAGDKAYYSSGNDRVFVDASGGLSMGVLVHEATHQLVYNTSVLERTRNGAVPAWVDEGLAEYMAGGYEGPFGRLRIVPGKARRSSFLLQARAEKPLSLNRILNLSSSDFTASRSDLKYAQVYTLVHFLMEGQDGRHRDPFLRFLRGAYEGQGSSTHFKSAFGVKPKVLEREWRGYVLEIAG